MYWLTRGLCARYKGKGGSETEALLSEDDELWMKLRHMHIAEVTA